MCIIYSVNGADSACKMRLLHAVSVGRGALKGGGHAKIIFF